jgi:hypothetical protein
VELGLSSAISEIGKNYKDTVGTPISAKTDQKHLRPTKFFKASIFYIY